MFSKCVFAISISSTKDAIKEKKEITEEIKRNGGEIGFGVSKNTTHLITTEKEINEVSFNVKSAYRSGAWVVLPSFVFDSSRSGRKEKEWLHTLVDKQPATNLAETEEEYLEEKFSNAIGNLMGLCNGMNVVENSLQVALRNISAVSIQLISKYEPDVEQFESLPADLLASSLFSILPDPSVFRRAVAVKAEEDEDSSDRESRPQSSSLLRTTFSSSLSMKKPLTTKVGYTSSLASTSKRNAFHNPLLKPNESSFMERAAQKKREREEKLQKIAEEKARKDEEKRRKEEERLRRDQERREREELAKQAALEQKRQREEESKRRLDSLNVEVFDWANYRGEIDEEEEEEREAREQREEEERQRIKKEEEKRKKKEKKKQQKQTYLAGRRADKAEKKRIKQEEEQRKAEEAATLAAEKERRRREYAARQEKKRLRELSGQPVQSAPKPPPNDDRKLFVGGLTFKDLDSKVKYPEGFSPEKRKKIMFERISHYFRIFDQFGPVEKKKDYILTKRHCFVIYKDKESLEKAIASLSKFEERQRLCKEIKVALVEQEGKQAKPFAPVPHFYVRRVNVITKGKKPAEFDN